jgi:GT2 family glycosyltransferase
MLEPNVPDVLPRVTFVILNWDQADMTLDCLRSLRTLDYPNFDVILVDNASSDDSVIRIRQAYPDCEIIENQENLGYSEGNNVGIRRALEKCSEFIFLLNNDTYVHQKMLSRLVSVAKQDPTAGITGPTMFYADPPNLLWGGKNWVDWRKPRVVREQMGEIVDIDSLETQPPLDVIYIDSCAILIRSQLFKDIGLMDNRYFINFDDIDLCLRARNSGYKIIYTPSAFMWHRVSAAMGVGSPANTYYMTRNALIFFARHSPGLLKIWGIVRILVGTLRTTIAWTFKPEYRTEKIYQRKRKANLLGLRDFILKRYGKMGVDVQRVCYAR